jgi:hypothetical protein
MNKSCQNLPVNDFEELLFFFDQFHKSTTGTMSNKLERQQPQIMASMKVKRFGAVIWSYWPKRSYSLVRPLG